MASCRRQWTSCDNVLPLLELNVFGRLCGRDMLCTLIEMPENTEPEENKLTARLKKEAATKALRPRTSSSTSLGLFTTIRLVATKALRAQDAFILDISFVDLSCLQRIQPPDSGCLRRTQLPKQLDLVLPGQYRGRLPIHVLRHTTHTKHYGSI